MNIVAVRRKLVAMPLIVLSGLGILAATSIAPNAGAAGHVPKGAAFYVPPKPLAKAKPGTIIRSAPMDAPAGARAWKILYHSRSVDGRDIAVSGVVVAPTGRAPHGGRVVVTWAHGTTGLGDQCTPSKQSDIASVLRNPHAPKPTNPGALDPQFQAFLDAGYVVAATDYEGLGTPGVHPYLVGESEGRSVLDAARAARGVKGTAAGKNVLVSGHSQGGQAALFAGELAASYAPELQVLGVSAEAPFAPDLEKFLPIIGTIKPYNAFVAMIVEGFHAAYKKFDPAAVLTPDALAQASTVTQKCFDDVFTALSSSPNFVLAHAPLGIPAMGTIVHTNSGGNRPAGAPVLVVQGTADEFVPQFVTDAFVKKVCTAGGTIDYRLYKGVTHLGVLDSAASDVASWFADRVSGATATSTCT